MFDDFCAIALYLIEILHQTTTSRRRHKRKKALYLIEILHQTTTFSQSISTRNGCILSKFYIKPQQMTTSMKDGLVVSYRNSTSNHNSRYYKYFLFQLYLIEILHQTTTTPLCLVVLLRCILSKFYIKPQLRRRNLFPRQRCILSKFYIKPQL